VPSSKKLSPPRNTLQLGQGEDCNENIDLISHSSKLVSWRSRGNKEWVSPMSIPTNSSLLNNCANCGNQIGKLETPFLWQEHVVCQLCHAKLSQTADLSGASRDEARPRGSTPDIRTPTEERSIYQTSLHPLPVFFGPVVLFLFLGLLIAMLNSTRNMPSQFAPIGFGVAVLPLVAAFIRFHFSKFVVTNRRITIKRGWLSLNSFEMLLAKVESIQIEQGLFERLLGTGKLVIIGTGGSKERFPDVKNIIEFRRFATESIERYVRA
jgi:membrane protein YdbS with pleckstrin-like domain